MSAYANALRPASSGIFLEIRMLFAQYWRSALTTLTMRPPPEEPRAGTRAAPCSERIRQGAVRKGGKNIPLGNEGNTS
ncbi:MAG: hypothetical protein NVSMB6_14300 [Burkholderiaceae bacterium]